MIDDNQSLVSATSKFGNPIPVYDDGFGPLFVYLESLGVRGIVRAQTWHDAYECVLDEILTPIPEEDLIEAYGFYVLPEDPYSPSKGPFHAYYDAPGETRQHLAFLPTRREAEDYCLSVLMGGEYDLIDGYQYQANATGTGIVSLDLNGESLESLTPELAKDLGIVLILETDD